MVMSRPMGTPKCTASGLRGRSRQGPARRESNTPGWEEGHRAQITQLLSLLMPRPEAVEKESIRRRRGKRQEWSRRKGQVISEGERLDGGGGRGPATAEAGSRQAAGKVAHSHCGAGSHATDPTPCNKPCRFGTGNNTEPCIGPET